MEDNIQRAIEKLLGLPPPSKEIEKIVKTADLAVRVFEREEFFSGRNKGKPEVEVTDLMREAARVPLDLTPQQVEEILFKSLHSIRTMCKLGADKIIPSLKEQNDVRMGKE